MAKMTNKGGASRHKLDAPSKPEPPAGPVLLDYRGFVSQRVEGMRPAPHVSRTAYQVLVDGVMPLVLDPGLNIVDPELWGHYEAHPSVKKHVEGDEDGDKVFIRKLDGLPASVGDVVDLADRTRNHDSLRFMEAAEQGRNKQRGAVVRACAEGLARPERSRMKVEAYRTPPASMVGK